MSDGVVAVINGGYSYSWCCSDVRDMRDLNVVRARVGYAIDVTSATLYDQTQFDK